MARRDPEDLRYDLTPPRSENVVREGQLTWSIADSLLKAPRRQVNFSNSTNPFLNDETSTFLRGARHSTPATVKHSYNPASWLLTQSTTIEMPAADINTSESDVIPACPSDERTGHPASVVESTRSRRPIKPPAWLSDFSTY